jgi:hypothetical protein
MRKVMQHFIAPPEAQAGTLPPTLSLHRFLKLIAKLTGHDLKKDGFDKRWIQGSGCVEVECGFWFNRKRHLVRALSLNSRSDYFVVRSPEQALMTARTRTA